MQEKKLKDAECASNWDALLKVFHKIVEDKPANVKSQLEKLKTKALNTIQLTQRQRDGVIDRCNNAIGGSYGNTKRPEHYTKTST